MISLISKLEKEGTLKKLVDSGFLSTTILFYYEVYIEFDKLKRIEKQTTVNIVEELAIKFNASTQTIYRCIRIMKDAENNYTEKSTIKQRTTHGKN